MMPLFLFAPLLVLLPALVGLETMVSLLKNVVVATGELGTSSLPPERSPVAAVRMTRAAGSGFFSSMRLLDSSLPPPSSRVVEEKSTS